MRAKHSPFAGEGPGRNNGRATWMASQYRSPSEREKGVKEGGRVAGVQVKERVECDSNCPNVNGPTQMNARNSGPPSATRSGAPGGCSSPTETLLDPLHMHRHDSPTHFNLRKRLRTGNLRRSADCAPGDSVRRSGWTTTRTCPSPFAPRVEAHFQGCVKPSDARSENTKRKKCLTDIYSSMTRGSGRSGRTGKPSSARRSDNLM